MENYSLEDRTIDYKHSADILDACMEFYDQLYNNLNKQEYTECEIDAELNWVVQKLKNKTLRSIAEKLRACIQQYCCDVNDDEAMMLQSISAESLQKFLTAIRQKEEKAPVI